MIYSWHVAMPFLLVLLFSAAPEGKEGGGGVRMQSLDASGFPEIRLLVTVRNAQGEIVAELGGGDFSVNEDEVPQVIRVLPASRSLSIALVLDSSGSMFRDLAGAKRAAIDFIEKIREEDEIQIIDFDREVRVLTGWTTDRARLREAIDSMQARGDTALHDAICEAVSSLKKRMGRKALVLLTDGRDDDGTGKPLSKNALEACRGDAIGSGVPVYSIGLGVDADDRLLADLAAQTGGGYYYAPTSNELGQLYEAIANQLSGEYEILYDTSLDERDGSLHHVRVRVQDIQGIAATTYRAPADDGARPPTGKAPKPGPPEEPTEGGPPAREGREGSAEDEDVISLAGLARLVEVSSERNSTEAAASNLLDGEAETGWISEGRQPQSLLLSFQNGLVLVNEIRIDPRARLDARNAVRDIEIQVSKTYAFRDWQRVASVRLDDPASSKSIKIAPTFARYLKFLFRENHGGQYFELAEIDIRGENRNPAVPLPPERVILSEHSLGARINRASSVFPDPAWSVLHLIDGTLKRQWAAENNAPQEVVIALAAGGPHTVTDISINPYTRGDASTWVREVEIQVSDDLPWRGFQTVGRLRLRPQADFQTISLERALPARFIKFLFLKNGGGGTMGAGEIRVYGLKQ